MTRKRSNTRSGTWLRCRIAWACVFVPHALFLTRSLQGGSTDVFQSIALACTVAFLGLKTLDLLPIRFSLTRRSIVAAVLIVALLHVGAIDRSLSESTTFAPWMVPVLIGFAFWLRRSCLGTHPRLQIFGSVFAHARVPWSRSVQRVVERILLRLRHALLIRTLTPHAPPV
jgi:hypothetical protein